MQPAMHRRVAIIQSFLEHHLGELAHRNEQIRHLAGLTIATDLWRDAVKLHRWLAPQIEFVRDHYISGQLRKDPEVFTPGTLFGDCEDLNLTLMGSILWRLHGPHALSSIYFPDIRQPQHVYLGVWHAGQWNGFDLSPPARQILPAVGQPLLWPTTATIVDSSTLPAP